MVSVFYFLCDYVCILIYCPFQSHIMHNKCCVNCRIYGWGGLYDVYPHGLYPAFFQLDPILDIGARTDQMGFNKNQRKSLQKYPRGLSDLCLILSETAKAVRRLLGIFATLCNRSLSAPP